MSVTRIKGIRNEDVPSPEVETLSVFLATFKAKMVHPLASCDTSDVLFLLLDFELLQLSES